jgi:hypothetical protein
MHLTLVVLHRFLGGRRFGCYRRHRKAFSFHYPLLLLIDSRPPDGIQRSRRGERYRGIQKRRCASTARGPLPDKVRPQGRVCCLLTSDVPVLQTDGTIQDIPSHGNNRLNRFPSKVSLSTSPFHQAYTMSRKISYTLYMSSMPESVPLSTHLLGRRRGMLNSFLSAPW